MLRAAALRMARATGGGVAYWIELPIYELAEWLNELARQTAEENKEVS